MADLSMAGSYDVLIIGAGMAGLSAAEHLVRSGIKNVCILEASDRVGGRMCTVNFGQSGKEIVELGANWIHGAALTNSVFSLASRYNLLQLLVYNIRMEGYCYTSDGVAIDKDLVDDVFKAYLAWEEESDHCFIEKEGKVISMEEFYVQKLQDFLKDYEPREHGNIRAVVNCLKNLGRFHMGGDLNDIPVGDTFPHCYHEIPGGNVKVPSGMVSIIRSLVNELPRGCIHSNQAVSRVQWGGGDSVTVTTQDGKHYSARHVICTTSLGFLKKHHKHMFLPGLPQRKAEAIEKVCFGKVNKVFLHYERPFWRQGSGSIKLAWTDADARITHPGEWYKHIFGFDEVLNNPSVLVAWVSCDAAEYMETLTEEQISDDCTTVIRRFLQDPSIPAPTRIIRSGWCKNPYTLGSYSYWGYETTPQHVADLAQPVSDKNQVPRLLFAGEATIARAYSTMHGARSSGLREAHRIRQLYNPASKL